MRMHVRAHRDAPSTPPPSPSTSTVEGDFVSTEKNRLRAVSMNVYPTAMCPFTMDTLLDDDAAAGEAEALASVIRYARESGVPFVVSATNAASASGECESDLVIRHTLGAALWASDFLLHLASKGASRVIFHTGTNPPPKAPPTLLSSPPLGSDPEEEGAIPAAPPLVAANGKGGGGGGLRNGGGGGGDATHAGDYTDSDSPVSFSDSHPGVPKVWPLQYGLWLFSMATANGARILAPGQGYVAISSTNSKVKVWALRRDGGTGAGELWVCQRIISNG